MTNFIFKSRLRDLQKISQQLKTILDNQRHLRNDIAIQQGIIMKIFNALALQKQVNEYYEVEVDRPHVSDSRDQD